jgi:uncharacterized protein YuzE
VEKIMSDELKILYDQENDVLSLLKGGREDAFIEIYPGINIELDEKKEFIGIEILNASQVLKDVLKPIQEHNQRTSQIAELKGIKR